MVIKLKIVFLLMVHMLTNRLYNQFKYIYIYIDIYMFSNQSQRTCPIMCLIICESHAKDKMFKSKYATLVPFHNSQ